MFSCTAQNNVNCRIFFLILSNWHSYQIWRCIEAFRWYCMHGLFKTHILPQRSKMVMTQSCRFAHGLLFGAFPMLHNYRPDCEHRKCKQKILNHNNTTWSELTNCFFLFARRNSSIEKVSMVLEIHPSLSAWDKEVAASWDASEKPTALRCLFLYSLGLKNLVSAFCAPKMWGWVVWKRCALPLARSVEGHPKAFDYSPKVGVLG